MNALRAYVEEHGLDKTSDDLHALLGKKITPGTVKLWAAKAKPPKAWAAALGLPAVDDSPLSPAADPRGNGGGTDDATTGRDDPPPSAPTGTKFAPPPMPVQAFAQKRIAGLYQFVGYGLGEGLRNPGVTKVWDDHSDEIAKAWIVAAEQSEFARRFVAMVTAGGPMGEVVILHATLLAGTLYVIGQFPEVGLFQKYQGYRPRPPVAEAVRPEPPDAAEPDHEPVHAAA